MGAAAQRPAWLPLSSSQAEIRQKCPGRLPADLSTPGWAITGPGPAWLCPALLGLRHTSPDPGAQPEPWQPASSHIGSGDAGSTPHPRGQDTRALANQDRATQQRWRLTLWPPPAASSPSRACLRGCWSFKGPCWGSTSLPGHSSSPTQELSPWIPPAPTAAQKGFLSLPDPLARQELMVSAFPLPRNQLASSRTFVDN